jgi:dihydrofolate reductase
MTATTPDATAAPTRRVKAALHMSLDGVVESPERWSFAYFAPEMGQAVNDSFASTDALLMGRVLYQEWADHWPHQSGPLADLMNGMPKYVVSTQRIDLSWSNSTPLDPASPADDLRGRLQEPGRDIAVPGSPTVVRWLLTEGLLDELRLFQYPLVLGTGKQLFRPGTPTASLHLAATTSYPTGVVDLTYHPVRKPTV